MRIERKTESGELVVVELTQSELRAAHDEYDFQNEKDDLLDVASSEGVELPEDFPAEDVLIQARHLRSKNECYMEGYWDSLKDAMYEELENKED